MPDQTGNTWLRRLFHSHDWHFEKSINKREGLGLYRCRCGETLVMRNELVWLSWLGRDDETPTPPLDTPAR